jgi:hypothetical protein
LAIEIDPKKPVAEKAKNYFPQDREGYGNKFVNLVI